MRIQVSDWHTKARAVEERAWGSYTTLYEHPGIKVKVLTINPGQTIPMQFHRYHDEHWLVLEGKGEAVLGVDIERQTRDLRPGQLVDVPCNRPHEIRAHAKTALQFLEIQVGLVVPGGDAELV